MKRWTTVRSKAASDQSGNRAGLTLLELMLVLGLLLVAGYFSTIALQSSFEVSDLQKAAEHVRKAVSESRARAIEEGLVYQLRFEPGGNQFIMVPDPSDLDDSQDGSTYHRLAGNVFSEYEFRKELEDAGPSESLDSDWFEDMADAGELASTSWSDPIEFSFEGGAEDAVFYLLDRQKRSVRIDIRGLTGAITVSNVSWEIAEQ